MSTATDITIEHYQRPEVKEIILNHALLQDGAWRALNGDFHRWYRYSDDGQARLLNAKEDYDHVTSKDRTLYQTLNVFDPSLWMISRPKEEITSDNPLGTPADTVAYTLGTDIDKGHGCDIEDPETRKAVEAAAQFLVDFLKMQGVHDSVWVLFSGGGIYVELHHEICKPKSKEDRAEFFELVTDRYNRLIAHVSEEFFTTYPEYVGRVKYDALNNSKRIFKCILSIHKSKPYAVTPLNRDAIKIDTERARFPVSDEMLAECRDWYSSYDPAEQIPFLKLLDEFKETGEEQRKKATKQFAEVWQSSEKIAEEHFPPCIKHIIETPNEGTGKTRFTAILTTYLNQMGWSEDDAWNLVNKISDRNGVGNIQHIFSSNFGRIRCPSCKTIQEDGAGYPHMGLRGLDVCKQDDKCPGCKWPGGYTQRLLAPDPTVIDAIRALASVCDGAHSKDGAGFNKFDRQKNSELIDQALEEGWLCQKDEVKTYKLLKKYTKQLKTLGIEYADIGMIDGGREADDGTAALLERIPEWIEEHHFKTVGDTEKIYHYDHGVYLDDGEKVLKECLGTEFPTLLNNKLVSDVVGNVKRRTYVDRDSFNNRNILNVKNGLIDLETGELKPHTHEYFTTAQLNVTYDPKALCPTILKFLDDVAQPCDVELLKELIGWLLWPDYHIHKAVMLIGIGRNGKGTLLRLITKFLGDRSISNVTLQELVGDQFAKADLYGKMANIGGDLPAKDLSDTAAFRNATGGDRLRAQEKFKSAFGFTNKAKMWFSANVVPRSNDDTFAFYARWFLIEFLNQFTLENGKADPDLDSKLQTDEELSGLLNIALAKLKTLRASGWKFSYNKTVEQVEVMYKRNSNPVYAFLIDECETGSSTDLIEKTVFWNRFNKYIKDHNLRPISSTKFGTLLKDQTEIPVNSYKLWTQSGDRPMCWQGVKLKDPNLPAFIKVGVTQRSDANPGLLSTPSIVKLDYTEIFGNNQEEKENEENKKIGRIEKTIDGIDGKGDKAKEAHDRELAAKHTKKPDSTEPLNLRIVAKDGYRTQDVSPDDPSKFVDRLYLPGEVIVRQRWKADDLIKKGIAEPVEASA